MFFVESTFCQHVYDSQVWRA